MVFEMVRRVAGLSAQERASDPVQPNLPNTLSSTSSILSLSAALGIDENALVDAFVNAGNGNHLSALADLAKAQKAVDQLKLYSVQHLRTDNTWNPTPWHKIAAALGKTTQAIQKKYAPLITKK